MGMGAYIRVISAFISSGMLGLGGMKLSLGSEITRAIGHFNCHFLKDANALNPGKVHYSTFKQTGGQLRVDWNRTSADEKDLEDGSAKRSGRAPSASGIIRPSPPPPLVRQW